MGVRASYRRRQSLDARTVVEETTKLKECEIIMALGFGACKLQVQVPEKGHFQLPKDLIGKTIGTTFINLAEQYFRKLELEEKDGADVSHSDKIETSIIKLTGSVEAAFALGVADGIVELVGESKIPSSPDIDSSDSGRLWRNDEGRWVEADRYRCRVRSHSDQIAFA